MAIEILDIVKVEEKIKKQILETQEEINNSESLKKKARYYATLKNIKDFIDPLMEKHKMLLIEKEAQVYFPDEDLKVVYQEGRKITQINTSVLFDNFIIDRKEDLKKIITITETSLKKLSDSEEVINRYKIELENRTNPSIKVSNLNKDEKIKLEEGTLK